MNLMPDQTKTTDYLSFNKRTRCTASQEAARQIRAGSAVIQIPLPDREPVRRDTYLAVNAAAYRLLGSGGYRLRQEPSSVTLIRSAESV